MRKRETPEMSLKVLEVLTQLTREEAISNLNQARLGKRVDMSPHLEKIIGCECTICEEGGVEFVTTSDPIIAGKERTPYKTAKEQNNYKNRQAS